MNLCEINLPKVVHVSLVYQRQFYFATLSDFVFFVCLAPVSNKIWGNDFKVLRNA